MVPVLDLAVADQIFQQVVAGPVGGQEASSPMKKSSHQSRFGGKLLLALALLLPRAAGLSRRDRGGKTNDGESFPAAQLGQAVPLSITTAGVPIDHDGVWWGVLGGRGGACVIGRSGQFRLGRDPRYRHAGLTYSAAY